ncbi:hypothetical protein FDP41_002350 [Naegleria fowleri]|uniref:VPS9 domain-containing protein n=1 Tax=Naegleria fowleri TaxID=5763 RepID=A0A6A5BY82_NAEFO|nr:uncharacterized protein FDP41_002350 [Naegleria fowleri]KAF0978530.1 hypothetical protein FDP41_002350 [Naegleria fowleri]
MPTISTGLASSPLHSGSSNSCGRDHDRSFLSSVSVDKTSADTLNHQLSHQGSDSSLKSTSSSSSLTSATNSPVVVVVAQPTSPKNPSSLPSNSTITTLLNKSGATTFYDWFNHNLTTPISDNIKTAKSFVSSSWKGVMSITNNVKESVNIRRVLEDFVQVGTNSRHSSPAKNDSITSTHRDQDQNTFQIQISLTNLIDNVDTLSPLFYNDEFVSFDAYQEFLLDYSKKLNNFLTNYFKIQDNIGINSKKLLELYDMCVLITKENAQTNKQKKYASDVDKCIQKWLFEVVAVDGTFNIHHVKDRQLYKKLKLFQNILTPKNLGLPNDFYKNSEAWNECVHLLRKIGQYKTPYGKKIIIERIFRGISEVCSKIDEAFSSDHLLSCTIYLILKACPHNLHSDMWFLVTFCLDGIYENEGNEIFGFLLTNMYCALEFWDHVPSFNEDGPTGFVNIEKKDSLSACGSGNQGSSNSSTSTDEEIVFEKFRIDDEEEKAKFKKAFKMARRRTRTFEQMIIDNFHQ